ncbi:MAG: cysteine peptidase family C39 domain-containing protein [Planctomycetota bacterium]|jgi:hypothetical protein
MKVRNLTFAVVLLFFAESLALANRQLDQGEITQILRTLTGEPRRTWIPSGTIAATHEEYESASERVVDSNVIVRYDGDKFYWEINILRQTEQKDPSAKSDDRSARYDSELNWNKRRVFVWDGERYAMYFASGKRAIVAENPSDVPVTVHGPLTAGIIPWGDGVYTLESLLAAESSAEADSQGQVRLSVDKKDMPEMIFVLDPTRDHAVLSYSMNYAGGASIKKTYGDYQSVSDKWIPTTIVIERYDQTEQPATLLSYDYWNLISVSEGLSDPNSFTVPYESDALVEFRSPTIDEPLSYRFHKEVDTDSLLQKRLAIVSAHDTQTQNCAAIAMKYVSRQLGRDVNDQQLAELVNRPDKSTSLYMLRQFAQELGLYCLAVKTNVQTLGNFEDCQVILHLPTVNHYVVLEHTDDEYVWVIDLDSNKFFYRTKLDEFALDWGGGTALLISNEPLALEPTCAEIDDSELRETVGSAGGFGNFSCTDLFQSYDVALCSPPVGGLCGGRYWIWYNRYACELDAEGGTCTGTGMVGTVSSPCINDPQNPPTCTITGEWFSQFVRACM